MNTKLLSILAALAALATGANAAISVGPDGSTVETFSTTLPVADWSTASVAGGAGDITDATTFGGQVTQTTASSVATAVADNSGNPPGANALALRSTAGYVQLRPTSVRYSLLMATLQNGSGVDKTNAIISYDFTHASTVVEQVPGFLAYYSFTGNPGEWFPIPSLSQDIATGSKGATLDLQATPWVSGGTMYLLWADDNGSGSPDDANQIDNFKVSWGFTPLSITQQPASVTVLQGRRASLTVAATGSGPVTYQWYHDGSLIDPATVNATANTPTLVITNMTSLEGGLYFCALNNPVGPINSDTVTITYEADTALPVCLYVYQATNDTVNATFVATFNEPIDPNSLDLFALSITAVGGGDALNIGAAEVVNGTNLLMMAAAPTPPTVYQFKPNLVSDPYTNVIATDLQVVPVDIYPNQILGPTASWQYNDSGTDLGTNWSQVGYDATGAGWQTGSGVFDGKRNATETPKCRVGTPVPDIDLLTPITTCINLSNATDSAQIPTVYFRSSFNFTGNTNYTMLQLRFMADDGVVFYLNGVEINRFGIAAGPVDYNTLANRTQNDSVLYWQTNIVHPGTALHEGNNVIAAELHQVNLTSSDLTFTLDIDSLTPVAPPATPRMAITPSGANVVITWTPAVGRLQSADDLASNPANTVWGDTGLSSGASIPASAAKKFYRIVNP